MTDSKSSTIRLQKYLASCGLGSRRYCEELIKKGYIRVNGSIVSELGTKISSYDNVEYKKKTLIPKKKVYYKLHKPRGYLSSNYDPHHSLFARDLLKSIPEYDSLFHVGRLDKNSSGLILFTNDGDFSLKLQHPRYEIEKEYYVRIKEKFSPKKLEICRDGVQLNNGLVYKIKSYQLISEQEVSVILTEGKKREIRNLFIFLGYTVLILHRTRIGSIELGNLKPGEFEQITSSLIQEIMR